MRLFNQFLVLTFLFGGRVHLKVMIIKDRTEKTHTKKYQIIFFGLISSYFLYITYTPMKLYFEAEKF